MIPQHEQHDEEELDRYDQLRALLKDPAKRYFVNYLVFNGPEYFKDAFRNIQDSQRNIHRMIEKNTTNLRSFQNAAANNYESLLAIDPYIIREHCDSYAPSVARRNERFAQYGYYRLKDLDCGKPFNLRRALAESQSPEAMAEMAAERQRRKLVRRARGADGAADAAPASGLGRRGRQSQQDPEGSRRRRQAGGRLRKYY